MKIVECTQGDDVWKKARCGIPTASRFSDILAAGEGKTRRKYMLQLAAEAITGNPAETYTNHHMERGIAMEQQAKDAYSFMTNHDLTNVGFVLDEEHQCGASPDALIGAAGVLELKTQLPELMIERMLTGNVPKEHMAQCQGSLWVTGRQWCDLAIFWPGLPLIRYNIARNEAYIAKLADAVANFHVELASVVTRVKRYRQLTHD
jgi:hypothetical protein